MSLINDALKRAKEAQQKAAPSADAPQLKAIEPAQRSSSRGIGVLVPTVLAVLALAGLVAIWQLRQRNSAANTPSITANAPAPTMEPVPAQAPPPATAETEKPVEAQTSKAVAPITATPVAAATPAPAAAAPLPPAPLKLQAIFFHPTRASAMISGKTVLVGDTIREFHVKAIAQESVTLANATQTNILVLPQ